MSPQYIQHTVSCWWFKICSIRIHSHPMCLISTCFFWGGMLCFESTWHHQCALPCPTPCPCTEVCQWENAAPATAGGDGSAACASGAPCHPLWGEWWWTSGFWGSHSKITSCVIMWQHIWQKNAVQDGFLPAIARHLVPCRLSGVCVCPY